MFTFIIGAILGIIAGLFIEKRNSAKLDTALNVASAEYATLQAELAVTKAKLAATTNAV